MHTTNKSVQATREERPWIRDTDGKEKVGVGLDSADKHQEVCRCCAKKGKLEEP